MQKRDLKYRCPDMITAWLMAARSACHHRRLQSLDIIRGKDSNKYLGQYLDEASTNT
jgi:hypothetical protein